jgi:hypothetical protein
MTKTIRCNRCGDDKINNTFINIVNVYTGKSDKYCLHCGKIIHHFLNVLKLKKESYEL